MKIRESREFQVVKLEKTADTTPKIVVENSKLKNSIEVLGGVLETQYIVDEDYLLFVTEGNPYEEALYIYLLDGNLIIKDSIELSAEYTAGILSGLSIIGQDTISFSFFDKEERWVLKIFDNPRALLWSNKYPVKRKSTLFKKKWLQLKKS